MEKYSINGHGPAQFETPFADVPVLKEQKDERISADDFFSGYIRDIESPFSRTYETPSAVNTVSEAAENYTDLIAELNDLEFNEVIYELVGEIEDTWRTKVTNELAMGSNYIPFA